ncbi:MAG: putative transport system ATP-binding protein [Thermoplasmata archaeon]|jgi:putative ABC transport system ATP-binding protein|nr:putative transport system ATP-binding protein [Thermoplasmata archaeon]
MDGFVIRADRLERVYGSQPSQEAALRGVDFRVRPGEMVAIMGPSGCGKTTLLNCLSGLDTPTKGTVVLAGQSLGALREPRLTRHRARSAGFIFQAYNLIPVLTVEENVMLPLVTAGIKEAEARPRARDLLARLGMAGLEGRLPSELSGGEQQRVAIARALVAKPAVVFADEPTGNLDSARAAALLDLLRAANRDGQTFVIVTHDAQVAAACGRVVRMADGRIVGDDGRDGQAA